MEEEGPGEMEQEPTEGVSRRSFLVYSAIGGAAAVAAGVGVYGYTQGWFSQRAPMQWWGIGTNDPELGYAGRPEDNFEDALEDVAVFTPAPWDPVQLEQKMCSDGRDQYDFISNAGTMHEPLFDCDSIVAFEPQDNLPSWNQIYPALRTNNPTITIQDTGDIVGVPIIQNGDSVAMDLDAIWGDGTYGSGGTSPGTGGTSYGLLFDDEYLGETAMEKFWACPIYKVANYLDRTAGETMDDLESLSNADILKIKDFMLQEKNADQFKTFWSGWETAVALLANKDVVALDTWEPVVFAVRAMATPINAYYMDAAEGFYLWNIPLYMTPKGQQNLDRVLNFFEWTLKGWYGARITTIRGYLTATPTAISYAATHPDPDSEIGGPYDSAFIQSRHTKVQGKFSDGVSVYGNQAPPNIQNYNDAWNEITA